MNKWKCPICGKEFENFGFKEFTQCPKTTLFGDFKIRDIDNNIKIIDRKTNKPVCSEECKQKNEEQYLIEEYKGNNIFCVNGKYMTYLECEYYYNSIEGIRNRIDNPHLIPVTPSLMHGLMIAMNGELNNI